MTIFVNLAYCLWLTALTCATSCSLLETTLLNRSTSDINGVIVASSNCELTSAAVCLENVFCQLF
ncbi:hypothetical protein [Trichormus azollae]|uniref:hypothetical protein n=1 Tax=Trichormus azollae TaxID=1164 RepID=UPI001E32E1FE|nr:hypothetical protein [Trichormus azollae]